MLRLPNVTLVTVNTNFPDLGIRVLQHCLKLAEFGGVKLFSNLNAAPAPIQLVQIPSIGIEGYSNFMVRELVRHITTDFVLIVQPDGFILNVDKWQDKFLTFDYIGAPWPEGLQQRCPLGTRVGNGGFSLRSRKFLAAAAAFTEFDAAQMNPDDRAEDFYLCKTRYDHLKANGIKFADLRTAADFSLEAAIPEYPRTYQDVFGFHGSPKHYATQAFLDMISGATTPR